jgi:hypothetical protein
MVAKKVLTGDRAGQVRGDLTCRRRLARSAAWMASRTSATYGYYVDDSDAAGWAGVMAAKGFKQTPFQGYHLGRDRLIAARVRGKGPEKQAGISYHWLMQPVVLVSDDGRSATGRFRLFQPRTGKTVGKAGDFFAAAFPSFISRIACPARCIPSCASTATATRSRRTRRLRTDHPDTEILFGASPFGTIARASPPRGRRSLYVQSATGDGAPARRGRCTVSR